MSIKSEKAREFIQNKLTDACDPRFVGHRYTMMLGRNNAFKAVRIAESDAWLRALDSFRLSCPCNDDGECSQADGLCCEQKCGIVENFLKHYDND